MFCFVPNVRSFVHIDCLQSIGMEDKESRGVWLGLGGAAVTVSAGAAMHGVKLAAESGAVLSRTASIAVTGLGAAAIASNGVVVANGFYGFFTVHYSVTP